MSDRIFVEDFIDGAIVAGYQDGTQNFLESLEEQLQITSIIAESGDAHNLLQAMIDETDGTVATLESAEHLSHLGHKLGRILK